MMKRELRSTKVPARRSVLPEIQFIDSVARGWRPKRRAVKRATLWPSLLRIFKTIVYIMTVFKPWSKTFRRCINGR